MRPRSCLSLLPALALLVTGIHLPLQPLQAQERKVALDQTVFSRAAIKWDPHTKLPSDIRTSVTSPLNREEFFQNLREVFELPDRLQFVAVNESMDPRGGKHIRYKQYYKGIELARTQYIIHMKDNSVVHAHGPLIGEPPAELIPGIGEDQAYRAACSQLGLQPDEARQNAAWVSRLSFDADTDHASGRLLLSTGSGDKRPENYRLVYSFDITTTDPLQRFDVEIDAQNGELAGKYPTLFHENIPTRGRSLYNDTIDIVISDTIFKSDWPDNEAYWHPDVWSAYQGSGTSWWVADTANFSPGGYSDNWHVVLESDAIELSGSQLQLTFYQRFAMEAPEGASDYNSDYDGWDGINVRISTDGGSSWEVLTGPNPAYTCTSLWSFGEIHREGPGIPGWAGTQSAWTQVSFNLAAYQGETAKIRFEFASDAAYSTLDENRLFGWQIDEIVVRNSNGTLFTNPGNVTNMHAYSISNWVGSIDGRYRLRETTRGKGIATINAENGLGFTEYVDFVQDTFPIMSENNRAGVSIHWASERSYDYFLQTFGRNSYDDRGAAIISYANWVEDEDRNNAFWAGTFAGYGAGDGLIHGSWGALDVVGHEITHGVTAHSSNLTYQGESGALNESFSDIFGSLIEFYTVGRDRANWLMGDDIYLFSGAIRSMEHPKELADPDTYLGDFWYNTANSNDYGGVHTNSGVQNHWFYLLSEGGSGENDDGVPYQVTGIGPDDAGAIAYRNLTNYLLPDSRYMDAAAYSVLAAEDLYGEDSQQSLSVRSAWEAVGIYMDARLSASDTLLHFKAEIDDSDYKLLILRNKGIESLQIPAFRFSNPDHFAIQPQPVSPLQLDGGDSVRLWIMFTPGLEGSYSDSLVIESSDPLNPVRIIHLSGVGTGSSTGLPENYREEADIRLSVTPNPFRDRLLISYTLPQPDHISMEIRDITGKLLYQTTREASEKETVEIIWSGIPEASRASTGGIYLLSLRTGTRVFVKKLVRR